LSSSLAATLQTSSGGGQNHVQVGYYVLRTRFAFFHALVMSVGMYASSADFDRTALLNPGIYTGIHLAADDSAALPKDCETTLSSSVRYAHGR
jgi:FMN reductase